MNTETTTATKITFERETCYRCNGSGQYPSAAWNGKCLGCSGTGKQLTKAGRAAMGRYNRYLASLPKVSVADIQAGDVVSQHAAQWVTVTEPLDTTKVYGTSGAEQTPLYAFTSNRARHLVTLDSTVARKPAFADIVAALSKRDGSPYAGVTLS